MVGTNIGSIIIFSEKLVVKSQILLSSSIIYGIRFVSENLMCVTYDNRIDLVQIADNVINNEII